MFGKNSRYFSGTLKGWDHCEDMQVVRVALPQTAVTALPARQHRPVRLDHEGAVLTTHHLKEESRKPRQEMRKLRQEMRSGWTYTTGIRCFVEVVRPCDHLRTCCAWEKDGAVVGTRMFLPDSASWPCRPAPHRYTSHFPPRCQSCKQPTNNTKTQTTVNALLYYASAHQPSFSLQSRRSRKSPEAQDLNICALQNVAGLKLNFTRSGFGLTDTHNTI